MRLSKCREGCIHSARTRCSPGSVARLTRKEWQRYAPSSRLARRSASIHTAVCRTGTSLNTIVPSSVTQFAIVGDAITTEWESAEGPTMVWCGITVECALIALFTGIHTTVSAERDRCALRNHPLTLQRTWTSCDTVIFPVITLLVHEFEVHRLALVERQVIHDSIATTCPETTARPRHIERTRARRIILIAHTRSTRCARRFVFGTSIACFSRIDDSISTGARDATTLNTAFHRLTIRILLAERRTLTVHAQR